MELEKKVEPNLGEIVKKIKALIEEKRVKDEELKELQEHRGAMEKQLDELNQEIFHLQSSCNTKEAHLKRLCFQYEQCQAQTERQLKASRESEQRIEELMTQIEGEKMKRRKERQEFEQQLEELIGKHKWMAEFYTPARLQLEMRNIENTKQQLLTEERMIMEKMSTLNKELDSVRQQGAASSEAIFLHSKEAKVTHQLFVEENKTVKELLRLAAENPLDPQQQALLRRFQEEWEPGRKVTNPDKNSDMEESKDGVQQEGHSKQRVQV